GAGSTRQSARNRLRTVQGQLDAVIARAEDERYRPELMNQLSTLGPADGSAARTAAPAAGPAPRVQSSVRAEGAGPLGTDSWRVRVPNPL
ncbi:MAG: metal-sensing transcriptional repressor, partial [Myxococcales bacterium]|nr:metal-sensing transcriptional repressor [Myxococcales bacterium]